jgi:hypothetical protein
MGGRVVEGTGLENRQTRKRLEGSNPSPSAILPDILLSFILPDILLSFNNICLPFSRYPSFYPHYG